MLVLKGDDPVFPDKIYGIIMILLTGILVLGSAAAEAATGTITRTLLAGQDIDVGQVVVYQQDGDLQVTYDLTAGEWYLLETHLSVVQRPAGDQDSWTADDLRAVGIPMATGNDAPIPGQMEFSSKHDPGVKEYSHQVDLAGLDLTAGLLIVAHAKVSLGQGGSWCEADIGVVGEGTLNLQVTDIRQYVDQPKKSNEVEWFVTGSDITVEFTASEIRDEEGDVVEVFNERFLRFVVHQPTLFPDEQDSWFRPSGSLYSGYENSGCETLYGLLHMEFWNESPPEAVKIGSLAAGTYTGTITLTVSQPDEVVDFAEETAFAEGYDFPSSRWSYYFLYP